jgi:hypothetical protein
MSRAKKCRERNAYFRRLNTDTSRRARGWRRRDEGTELMARDQLRRYHGERLSWGALVQALEDGHGA